MGRPFIEFIHSQALVWQIDLIRAGRANVEIKLLSEDTDTGAVTLLMRCPGGEMSSAAEWCMVDEEIFVLEGELELNGQRFTRHHYAYWPAGYIRHRTCVARGGVTAIVCFSGRPVFSADLDAAPAGDPAALTEHLNPYGMRWDQTNMDPNISHLNAYRKNLRLGPDNSGRTYLLAGLPQGYPSSGAEPLERHPHVEEMFMVSGDMACSLGVMRAGAYFWRPPMIWHGADCTASGFLIFARTPGTNRTISEWSAEAHPVRFDPEHRPVLPPELADAACPLADPVGY